MLNIKKIKKKKNFFLVSFIIGLFFFYFVKQILFFLNIKKYQKNLEKNFKCSKYSIINFFNDKDKIPLPKADCGIISKQKIKISQKNLDILIVEIIGKVSGLWNFIDEKYIIIETKTKKGQYFIFPLRINSQTIITKKKHYSILDYEEKNEVIEKKFVESKIKNLLINKEIIFTLTYPILPANYASSLEKKLMIVKNLCQKSNFYFSKFLEENDYKFLDKIFYLKFILNCWPNLIQLKYVAN